MKDGISLVVLVITIIVLIVLTTTVMLLFKEGGIIDRAQEATFKSDFANIQNSFIIHKNNMMLENLGNVNITETDKEKIENNIPLLKKNTNKEINGYKYWELLQIQNSVLYQSNTISSSNNENDIEISRWLEEVGILKFEIPEVVEYNIYGYWEIDINANKECAISRYTGEGDLLNNITIPSVIVKDGERYTVTAITPKMNDSVARFTGNLIIPDTVETIGQRAFANCRELVSVTIGNNVTIIENFAFQYCSGITQIDIPNSVTKIGSEVFAGCSNLKNLKIGNGATIIEDYAFIHCSSLQEINVNPENTSYSSVDKVLFNKDKTIIIKYPEAKNDIEYQIPDGVVNIGNSAFQNNKYLTSINIPNSVVNIGTAAFRGSESLTNITIPSSVTLIGDVSFNNCDMLNQIIVDSKNMNYASENGVLFSKNKTTLITYPKGKNDTEYIVPNAVTTIKMMAFYENNKLKEVTIPNSVRLVGSSAFGLCSSLSNINVYWDNNVRPDGWPSAWNYSGISFIPVTYL